MSLGKLDAASAIGHYTYMCFNPGKRHSNGPFLGIVTFGVQSLGNPRCSVDY